MMKRPRCSTPQGGQRDRSDTHIRSVPSKLRRPIGICNGRPCDRVAANDKAVCAAAIAVVPITMARQSVDETVTIRQVMTVTEPVLMLMLMRKLQL